MRLTIVQEGSMVKPLTGLVKDLQYVERVCKDHVEESAKSELPDESANFTVDALQRSVKQIQITVSDYQLPKSGKTIPNQRKNHQPKTLGVLLSPCTKKQGQGQQLHARPTNHLVLKCTARLCSVTLRVRP